MILCPARLEPVFHRRPWGSLSLAPFFPELSHLAEPVGEAWMTGNECKFAVGPYRAKTLAEAWRAMPPEWAGTNADRDAPFPLLVKFIFSEQKLSVQVHPHDTYAAQHEKSAGGRGKTEMWYVMRAEPGAEVLAGLRAGATREKFERAIRENTAEDWLERVSLNAGDVVFVPAGTLHTIGPGLVLCEIQEHSDLTYRVYDYNRRDAQGRPRELHIDKALDVIQFGEQSGGKIEPAQIERSGVTTTYFVACRYFATEKWEFTERVASATSREHFDLLIILEGLGNLYWRDQHAPYAPMQVWVLPAGLGAYQLTPDSRTSVLRSYVPQNLDEFVRRLADQGISESVWSRLVYP